MPATKSLAGARHGRAPGGATGWAIPDPLVGAPAGHAAASAEPVTLESISEEAPWRAEAEVEGASEAEAEAEAEAEEADAADAEPEWGAQVGSSVESFCAAESGITAGVRISRLSLPLLLLPLPPPPPPPLLLLLLRLLLLPGPPPLHPMKCLAVLSYS